MPTSKKTITPTAPANHKLTKSGKIDRRGNKKGVNHRTGYRAPTTMQRIAQKRHMIDRIVRATDSLLDAQMSLALGERVLIHAYTVGSKSRKRTVLKIVEDPQTIIAFLEGGLNQATDDDEYYYMTVRPANHLALQGLLDRAYGRATNKVEVGDKDDDDLSDLTDEELDARIQRYLGKKKS